MSNTNLCFFSAVVSFGGEQFTTVSGCLVASDIEDARAKLERAYNRCTVSSLELKKVDKDVVIF